MKFVSPRLRMGLAAAALLALLVFQIRWIMHAGKLKEEIFAEKKAMVVARVTEDIYNDEAFNRRLSKSFEPRDRLVIDSLVQKYLKYYGLNAAYSFTIVYPSSAGKVSVLGHILPPSDTVACYTESLEEQAGLHAWMLQLEVNKPEEALLMFPVILSSLLVGIVFFVFYKSLKSWQQEKSLLEQTRDFMNNMAHEFRTPITNIGLATKMLQREGADREKYLQMIREENSRLSDQVDTVLNLYSVESGRHTVQRERVDLKGIVASSVQRFSLQAAQKGIVIQPAAVDEHCIVSGDPQLLSLAIGNLIDNALKYAGATPVINLKVVSAGQWVEVHVTDNGPGIPTAHHQKIFERYYRISNQDVHNVKGFGLGLAFVQEVIRLHLGSIQLKSDTGKGTTFTLRLPNEG